MQLREVYLRLPCPDRLHRETGKGIIDWFLRINKIPKRTTPVPSLEKGGEPEGYGCPDGDIE
jgi:hypothetical protein